MKVPVIRVRGVWWALGIYLAEKYVPIKYIPVFGVVSWSKEWLGNAMVVQDELSPQITQL